MPLSLAESGQRSLACSAPPRSESRPQNWSCVSPRQCNASLYLLRNLVGGQVSKQRSVYRHAPIQALGAYAMLRARAELVTLVPGVSSRERPTARLDPYPIFLTP